MQVTKEQIDPCTISLDIEVEPETVKKAFDRAYREFGNFTNVPGFRPGKAPRPVLERYVNQERLRDRVRELVATPAYRDAIKDQEITAYDDPEVEFSDLDQEKPWRFKAVVPTPPIVELGDYKTISVERPVYEVTDDEIESTILSMRDEYARLERVEGRGVELEDVLIAETLITPEGSEPEGEPQRKLIRLGNNIPGFDEAMLGMNPDEERVFTLTYPEDYQDADVAGKQATFTVKLLSINKRVIPDLTDEWVKQATSFKTVDELKEDVRKHMAERLAQTSDQVAEARIVEEIVKRSKIDFPKVMVQDEMQSAAEELSTELQKNHISYEQYLQVTGQTEQQHHAKLESDATARVKRILVLRELAGKESLLVSGDEINREFDKYLDAREISDLDREKIVTDRGRRTQVANLLVQQKLREFLLNNAKITDVKPKNS